MSPEADWSHACIWVAELHDVGLSSSNWLPLRSLVGALWPFGKRSGVQRDS